MEKYKCASSGARARAKQDDLANELENLRIPLIQSPFVRHQVAASKTPNFSSRLFHLSCFDCSIASFYL